MDLDDLIDDLGNGDEAAGALLVSIYGPQLCGYARAVAGDLGDADREQICERAVEQAVRKIDRFDRSKGSFVSWLRGFVRHEAGNWRRSLGALERLDDDAAESPPPDAARELTDHERAALRELVSRLSLTDQLILALRDGEQLAYAEIANRLGTTEAAARQRHRRALQRLRELAGEDGRLRRWRDGR